MTMPRVDQSYRRAQDLLRRAFEDAPVGIAMTDGARRFLRVNRALCRMLGRSADELLSMAYEEIVHPDDRAAEIEHLPRILAGEVPSYESEQRYVRPDGSVRLGMLAVSVATGPQDEQYLDPDQQPRCLIRHIYDITELERSDEGLRESEQRFFQFAEHLPLGVMVLDATGAPAYGNRALMEIFGRSSLPEATQVESLAEAYGAYFAGTDELYPLERLPMSRVFRGERDAWIDDMEIHRPDGSVVPIEGWANPILDEQGNLTYVIGALRDITERRLAEKALRERTAELEAANKELDSFSYSVSHDLRRPLRAIDGFARILLEEHAPSLSDEASRYLGLVRDSAQRMGQLMDDLLAFSRLARQPLKAQVLAPGELVRQVLEELRSELEGRAVEISIGDLPMCRGDASLLRQVFVNLLSNALKFTRHREVALIDVGWHDDGDGTPVFFVKDNGAGFDIAYADKLFGVFKRLHRQEDFEGTGVGLAIVQRIVERHGGRIWAKAELDRGAVFSFTLGGQGSIDE
jgi:PAS domain S-box-containing protein